MLKKLICVKDIFEIESTTTNDCDFADNFEANLIGFKTFLHDYNVMER